MKTEWLIALALLLPVLIRSEEIQKISLAPSKDMTRADLYAITPRGTPNAVLVLCPGANGNGEGLIRQREWQEFSKQQHLGLVGLSFASDGALLNDCGRGYYCAARGSGIILLNGIRKIYGRDLPILLYGFSGGAHFTSGFVEWKPERVISWCAYSAYWWDKPQESSVSPPGIVACGDEDLRYGASMIYFKQGRAAGKPWLWVSVPKTGHSPLPAVETFVRHYFASILAHPHGNGFWIDVDLETPVTESQRIEQPSLAGWLPDAELFEEWKAVNQP